MIVLYVQSFALCLLSTQYLLALEVIFSVSFYRRTVLQIDPKGGRVLFNSNLT